MRLQSSTSPFSGRGRIILFAAALAGAFLAGVFLAKKYSARQPPEESEPLHVEQPKMPPAEETGKPETSPSPAAQEKFSFLEQCTEPHLVFSSPFFLPEEPDQLNLVEFEQLAQVKEEQEEKEEPEQPDQQKILEEQEKAETPKPKVKVLAARAAQPGKLNLVKFEQLAQIKKEPEQPDQQKNAETPELKILAVNARKKAIQNKAEIRRRGQARFVQQEIVTCSGGMLPALRQVVANLEAQSIRYARGPLSDCSGIFHRVLQGMQRCCPGYAYPSVTQYRDSRAIARWYHERGRLVLVNDALQNTHLIRPGMVFFFGRTGKRYKKLTVPQVLSRWSGIYHVGIVVRVHRDKRGRVVRYELFHGHGRRGRTPASTTAWHRRNPSRSVYPPFGNGRQQWIAAAPLLGSGKR
ncbi:MAG: hypothetical protein ACL93V_03005 [Candidatus Electrothrix sp. YB6]